MMEDTLLLQALAKIGLSEQFYKHKERSKAKREALPIGLWHNYHDFMAEYLLYLCNMTADIKVSKVALEEANSTFEEFHDAITGYLKVEMHNRNVLLKEDWPIPAYSSVEAQEESNNIQKLYKYLICLKYSRDAKYFYSLKTILKEERRSHLCLKAEKTFCDRF